jgi:hypothetical protein
MTDPKSCFVIAPIGDPGGPIRKRSDQVLRHLIRPVLEPLGYSVTRADEISQPGMITRQVTQRVLESSVVVADLTGHNPNVFYELAIRHAIKKPLVQLIGIDDTIPFDVAGMRTIKVNIRDLDSVEEAKDELGRQVQAIEVGELEPESPITQALALQALEASGNPQADALVNIQAAITELRLDVQTLSSEQQSSSLDINTILQLIERRRFPEDADLYESPAWMLQRLADAYEKVRGIAEAEVEDKAGDSEVTPDSSKKAD